MADRKTKILILTAGHIDHPSSRTRATQFFPDLENKNCSITWIPRVAKEAKTTFEKLLFPFFKRYYYLKMRFHLLWGAWDLVFVQRAYLGENFLKLLKRRNIPLVFDFDDALYLHANDKKGDKSFTGLMITYASAVIVSTPYLSPFCESFGKKPIIIPTSVDGGLIKPNTLKNKDEVPVVGWIGSFTTTITIKQGEEGLRRLAKRLKYRLILIGADPSYQPEGVPFEHYTWQLEKEPDFLKQMDIGIMPLPLTKYSEGKGGYKLFLYMAAAIPSVATPIGINSELIQDGVNGFLASEPEEWEEKMHLLLTNSELRQKMGYAGRQLFDENYSSKIAFDMLYKILNDLVKNSSIN